MAIKNQQFLDQIKAGIASHGATVIAVSATTPCGIHQAASHCVVETDCYLYTIGHRERGRPDLLFLCGPTDGTAEPAMTLEETMERMSAVHRLINSLVANWDTSPVLSGHTCEDATGRVYRAFEDPVGQSSLGRSLCIQAKNYYDTDDYALLVFFAEAIQPKSH